MKIGFVIVNYNDSRNALNLVNTIKDFKSISEIVIVDNNSNKKNKDILSKIDNPKTEIIELEENKGYSYALNAGAKHIISKLGDCRIILSNTDIEIEDEEVIYKLSNMINNTTKCVMPIIKENEVYKYGWKLTSPTMDILLNIPLLNRVLRNKYREYDKKYFKQEECLVDVIYGCFFMIDSRVLKLISYFDSNVFLYYEEYILARKLESINVLSKINTSVSVVHKHNTTIGNNVTRLNKYKIYKKSFLYYEKNYNKANFINMLFFKLFYLINLIPYKFKK